MLKNGLSEYKNRMVTKNKNRKSTCLNIRQKCENCLKYTVMQSGMTKLCNRE